MVVVIFKATINELDAEYFSMANTLRETAIKEYGCLDFYTLTEGNKEISISYWNSFENIEKWRDNELHVKAKEIAKNKWYSNYTVEVCEQVSSNTFSK